MEDVIRVAQHYYILATSGLADDRTLVLKNGESFGVFDRYGDIQPIGMGEQGLYHEGTRFLSHLSLTVENGRPLLLSSTVREDNFLLAVDLTNPDVHSEEQEEVLLPRGSVHFYRSKFLRPTTCFEEFRIRNYNLFPITISFALKFDSDFCDIFEVRGHRREQKGERLPDRVEGSKVTLSYRGLDTVIRHTVIECQPEPSEVSGSEMRFTLNLESKAEVAYVLTITCESEEVRFRHLTYEAALVEEARELEQEDRAECLVTTSNDHFNHWWRRSVADLRMMITPTPVGPYPYAGVPWFSAPFGRDGIITAMECLWLLPDLARGVLAYLASTQAQEMNPGQDAEPGKILHESRRGEMAFLGEIPFRRYYGSVDATPLFIMLAGEYYQRTGDRPFIESIWHNIEMALEWMDVHGDCDGDGLVEYYRRSNKGLIQQGWKDSHDSVFHSDGHLAEGPIALCEVQGYVFAARQRAAALASMLGQRQRAEQLLQQADQLRQRFETAFWSDRLGCYALALDGAKRPCLARTSNAGHCLFSGIAQRDHARTTAETLTGEDFFTGWGIRTLAASEMRYNPMSYHNGSVWPHDNALIARGFARYGFKELAAKVMNGLFEAASFIDLYRLPELFCGFQRRPGKSPTLYPVACNPQAWAAGSVFLLLQSCLGLTLDGPGSRICFTYPFLPESLREVQIKNLQLGAASVDLHLERYAHGVGISVTRRSGQVEVMTVE